MAHSDEQAHLHFALTRLKVSWRALERPELEVLLRHLLMAEHRCTLHRNVVPERPTNRWLLPRLRRRRQTVARRLVARGGRVSPLALKHALPRGSDWPGLAALVGRQVWAPADRRSAQRIPRPMEPQRLAA
ncbi:hypothetical protein [Roseateles amylovorans]|uniref:Uncharacterized protein n=1 Tax=Roseateles amylovorans TaxID=2978473 RepID=A0ABY6B1F2_9BURK|nr:hypothetical protein [Roseateles amylovorans]UXH77150.1 hypothetical protein N4261_19340 [Roseateles amylovorans]